MVKRELPIGTKVVRGPDWTWGSQDTYYNGRKQIQQEGTVVEHRQGHPTLGFCYVVRWGSLDKGSGEYLYRWSPTGIKHIIPLVSKKLGLI